MDSDPDDPQPMEDVVESFEDKNKVSDSKLVNENKQDGDTIATSGEDVKNDKSTAIIETDKKVSSSDNKDENGVVVEDDDDIMEVDTNDTGDHTVNSYDPIKITDDVIQTEKQKMAEKDSENKEQTVSTSGSVEVVQIVKDDDTDHDVNSIDSLPINKDTTTNNYKDDSSDSSIKYEYVKKRRKMVWQCINPQCSTSKRENLITASSNVLSMYNYDYDPKKKRKVCRKCNDNVEKEMQRLIAKIDNNEALLNEILPVPEDVMELEDSDEKSETDESMSSEVDISCSSDEENLSIEKLVEKKCAKILEGIDISSVISESASQIKNRYADMEEQRTSTTDEINRIEKAVEKLRNDLYKPFEPTITSLPEVDLNEADEMTGGAAPLPMQRSVPLPRAPGVPANSAMMRPRGDMNNSVGSKSMGPRPRMSQSGYSGGTHTGHSGTPPQRHHQEGNPTRMPFVPQPGTLKKPPLTLGAQVFHLRGNSTVNMWKEGVVEEIMATPPGEPSMYKIKFENLTANKKIVQTKQRDLKQLAYKMPAMVKLQVGTRVIALYHEKEDDKGAFYAGIIAECPKALNNLRYLVFFDDGVARYVQHKDVRVICHSSSEVSEDVHPNSRDFIREYLKRYPERPMVKLNVGQAVKTEYEGQWHITRVKKVDASLVRLLFEQENRYEWVYRGSTRLSPLFQEIENQKQRKEEGKSQGLLRRRLPGLIEYTSQKESTPSSSVPSSPGGDSIGDGGPKKHNVARKSGGARRPDSFTHNTIQWDKEGNVNQVDVSSTRIVGRPFKKHSCSDRCIEKVKYEEADWRGTNPLLIPIMLGWDRQVHKLQGKLTSKVQNKTVSYVAPCGRSLRNLEEVHRYLRITQSMLEIDFFNMDWFVSVFQEWSPKRTLSQMPDLSYGKENVPIPCINSVDNSYPDYIEYSTVRIPKDRVYINTDEEFLVGCDCIDDCQNTISCSCHQLTIQAAARNKHKISTNPVYKFRRLMEFVPTGIYECNKMCKCAKTCLNRVAQNPLRNKLQVFKTDNRDWGVRTLCDIPKGGFICIYVGNLLDIEESNTQGKNFGDEYFADLDLIEMVERQKEGYEEDVVEPDNFPEFIPSGNRSPESNSTDEEYDPVIPEDREFKVDRRTKSSNSASDRSSRSKISQMDGGADITSSSSSDEEMESKKTKKYINDLIHKPDPFANNMVIRKKWDEVTEDDILVAHPSQVDGGMDDSDDDDYEILEERRPLKSGFSAPSGMLGPKLRTDKFKSTRKFFGNEEEAYTMDAKSIGNIGRYLNHCCEPNCFVQSVFVDTHDLRFHWVAFFAHCHIQAGTELHWDYNYEPGMIEGRELMCKCVAEKCRGRLL